MPNIPSETADEPKRVPLPVLDERCVRALAAEYLTNPRQRQVYLLHYYGDVNAPGYTIRWISRHLHVVERTIWRDLAAANDIMRPVIDAEIARQRSLLHLNPPAQPNTTRHPYEVTLERGDESETVTLETEMCALTGAEPGKSNWKTGG